MSRPRHSMLTVDMVEAALSRGPLTAFQLRQRFQASKATIASHLARLRREGRLVEIGERNDREYAIARKAVAS